MRIGLISRGRTYSTAIGQSLAHMYNLKNLSENYLTVHEIIRKNFNKSDTKEPVLNLFKEKFLNYTNNLFTNENFVCKLWPNMLMFIDYHSVNSLENNFEKIISTIEKSIIFEISKYWQLQKYDKLFFLDRNLKISTVSWVYIKKIKRSHLYKNSKNKLLPEIKLENYEFNLARRYILDYCIQQRIKDFLIKQKLPFIEIHENHKKYINQNVTTTLENNTDYNSLISNYNDIEILINEWYPICLEKTKDWYFY